MRQPPSPPSAAEALAQIRLNLSAVDQFLAGACSLADDNPSICASVHEAAREARQSALLIDHLRTLFGHQRAVEAQQGVGGQLGPAPELADNLLRFSYSNQLTLVRASKALVANVAKIVYLTDSVVLQVADWLEPAAGQKQQQQQQRDKVSVSGLASKLRIGR